jgi:hypothetical protein
MQSNDELQQTSVRSCSGSVIHRLNNFSRECLEKGDLEPAFKVLKKCEHKLYWGTRPIHNKQEVMALTLENLGMYYRMKNKPLIAVRYL